MRAGSLATSGFRHALVAIGEAVVVALIIATVLLALSPLYRPAETLSGTSAVDAGRARGWLSLAGDDLRLASVSAGGTYTVVGGGFQAGVGVTINLGEPGCCRFFTVWPNADGEIAFTTTAVGAGTYEVKAFQRLNPRKLTLMASLTFEVAG